MKFISQKSKDFETILQVYTASSMTTKVVYYDLFMNNWQIVKKLIRLIADMKRIETH